MSNELTYAAILKRCEEAAIEAIPDFPKENTLEAWEDYYSELDSLEIDSWEIVESWDWSIYTHWGWKILHTLSQSEINQAESDWIDCGGLEGLDHNTFDIWNLQSQIAFHALMNLVREQWEEAKADILELAQNKIDQLESE